MFKSNLEEKRPLEFHSKSIKKVDGISKDSTIWTHFREGSSEYDDIYKYCYTVKQLDESKSELFTEFSVPLELEEALKRKKIKNPYTYLSNSVAVPTTKNRVWRAYWFKYMAHKGVLTLYDKDGKKYKVHEENSKIRTLSGNFRAFFAKNKKKLVDMLNEGIITEEEAWEQFAENIKNRAHSYRIDIETFTYGIGLVDSEFKLTELGYRYVNSCTSGDPFENLPKKIFAGACLNNGNMNVFLQFLHRITENELSRDGVQVQWCTPYESVGAKDSKEGDETTGGGLAWGGGCSPSLTSKLVMFTDNQDPVNLLALDMKTGEIVASMPVIDELPKNMQVSVENSAMVYDNGEGTVSTIVCNWFGAGSAKLADADNDSSIQTYENIYDVNWLKKGNKMVVPGVERVDTIKTKDGYEMKSIWCRNDIRDTSMMKLSTATGYIYGYVQDLESGMWQFIMLDFETGETVFTMDVSDKPGYNNMAIGMYAGNSGNTLYCPTGYLELLRLQDRFVYLPEMPYRKVDLDKTKRNVLTQEEFTEAGGKGNVAGWLNTITVENVHPNTTVAIRMKGIAGKADTFTLYAYDKENKLKEVPAELWHIQEEDGTLPDKLTEDTLYEVHVMVEDGGEFDLSDTEKEIKIAVILGNK